MIIIRTLAAAQPVALLWSYSLPVPITTTPTLASDGTMYVGTAGGLYAVTNAGSNRWTFPVSMASSGTAIGSPAIGSDGTVYCGGGDAVFYAINPDGSQKWAYALQPEFQYKVTYASTPAIGHDGSIYFVASGRMYAFSSAGSNKWELAVDNPSISRIRSPVVGGDGTVYIGSYFTRTLYAVNSDGSIKWQLPLENPASESVAVGRDGTIYTSGNSLHAVSPQGSNLWTTVTEDFLNGIPAVGRNGTIYIESHAAGNPGLHAFTPAGEFLWRAGPSPGAYGYPSTCAAIDANDTLYFSSSNSVFAISPGGNAQLVYGAEVPTTPPPPEFGSPTIGPDGTIYAAFFCTLYAIGGAKGAADAPWPMYHQNARHTGRIEKPSVSKPQKRADANFQFQIYDTLGNTNTVQASTDFASWTSLTDIVVTNVPMDFIDYTASNFASRFYRTIQQ